MRRLPQKSVKGANLKKWLVESIDALIDYLSDASYLQPGTGIGIDRTASGVMISALKPKPAPAQSLAGGTVQNLSATVSGGTATVALSGSTATVPFVAGANVNITGGTNGELLIGASAMSGVPNYASPIETITLYYGSSTTKSYAQSVWLIGSIGVNTAADMDGSVSITIDTTTIDLFDLTIGSTSLAGLTVPLSLLIPANSTFTLSVSGAAVAAVKVFPSV